MNSMEKMANYNTQWRELRLKNVVTINNGKDYKEYETSEGIPVIGSGGQFAYVSKSMYNGEVVFLGRKGTIDRPLYYNGPFWSVDTMFYAVPNKIAIGKFIYYYATLFPFKKYSTATALPSMTQTALYQIPFNLPTIEEQQRIVDYLDAKLSEIDKRVSVLEKQKNAYARLKKSIIHQAVTRGLNPDVRLKDSGLKWIGMIPEHWEVKRLKDVVSINAETLPEDTPYNYTFKYIDISNVSSEGIINLGEGLTFDESPSRARRIVKKGDVLVSTVRTYLRAIARIDFEANNIIASTGFAVLSPKRGIDSAFIANAVRDANIVDAICSISTGVSYPAISASRLSSISIAMPPLEEQRGIAASLNEKCAKIDAAIENIGKQIEASKRLKRAIINEAICGKSNI